jgi:hypothetical protein
VTGNAKFNLRVVGYTKLHCKCASVKNQGVGGFKLVIDTSKLTSKDAGEYTMQTFISLEGNAFKTETQSFNLVIASNEEDADKPPENAGNETELATNDTEAATDRTKPATNDTKTL